jgi:hypothetical protein
MKTYLQKITLGLALAAAVFVAAPSHAQVSSVSLYAITNVPAVVPASLGTNGYTNQVILLTKNCCLALASRMCVTNGTSQVTIGGSFSLDTTNFGIAPFLLTGVVPSNNVVAVMGGTNQPAIVPGLYTNWNQQFLSGFAAVMLNIYTNGSSTSSVYNADIKLSRPTLNTSTY